MIKFIRRFLVLFLILISFPTLAADNTVVLTPGSGVTMRTKDIGAGVQSPFNILGDTSGASIYGTAGTANANVITVQGIASGTALPVSISGTVTISNSNLSTATNQVTTNSLLTSILAGVQSAVPTNPKTTTEAKVTISVTNTYQQALASSSTRVGCTIQYVAVAGTKGYVFFGSAPADTTTSFQLTNGQSLNCAIGGVAVAQDAIQLTGTATDIFVVSNQ